MNFFIFYILSRGAFLISAVLANNNGNLTQDKFLFQPTDIPLGIYFERISNVQFFKDQWHIVYHIDLKTIHTEYLGIKGTVKELHDFCDNLKSSYNFESPEEKQVIKSEILTRECGALVAQIDIIMDDIDEFSVYRFHGSASRVKRAPFNFVGTLFNALFGTLSQEDAEKYLRQFQVLERNAMESRLINDKQTTLLSATAQALKQLHADSQYYQIRSDEQFSLLSNLTDELHANYDNMWINMEIQFQLNNLVTYISLALSSFHEKQKRFIDALSVGSQGHSYTPIIIPPEILIKELKAIKTIIAGKELDMPLEIDNNAITFFYQIATTRSRIVDDQLIVQMSVPIVSTKKYEIMKLTSFPNKLQGDTYSFMVPNHEYVAIDSLRENLIPLTQRELDHCHNLEYQNQKFELICMQLSPFMSIKAEDCTSNLLMNKPTQTGCEVRLSNITSEVWIGLQAQNTWIAVFPRLQTIYVKCDHMSTFDVQMLGTGIVSIADNCQIKTDYVFIPATRSYKSKVYSRIQPLITYGSEFNDTLRSLNASKFSRVTKLDHAHVIPTGEHNKLKELSSSLIDLERFTEMPSPYVEYMMPQDGSVFTTLSAFILFMLAVYLIGFSAFQYYRNHHSYSPQSAQRASRDTTTPTETPV